jgi:TonB family protein
MTCTSCGNNLETYSKFCPKCGAPVQPQAPPVYQGPPAYTPPQSPMSSGSVPPPPRKSGCGKIILILAIILLILGGAVAAAIYFGYQSLEKTLKSSEAYTVAVSKLKENEEVRNQLGEITDTGFPLGSFSQDADGSGNAAFAMSVEGTKGKGQYEVSMVRSHSVWRLTRGSVRTETGKIIQVVDEDRNSETDSVTNDNTNSDFDTLTNTNSQREIKPGQTISGGVLNGKATSLPKPAYPPIARQAHASGAVVVQVLVDEQGNVVTANAVSGHPLLRASATAAARAAKFTPTKLSGKPVKVSGTIIYTFTEE